MEDVRSKGKQSPRIIPVFARAFGALVLGTAAAAVQAQGGYRLKLDLDYDGNTYTVPTTSIPASERVELIAQPGGALKVYVRAMRLPGTSGQTLLDMQVYHHKNGALSQLSSLSMPAYLGADNTAEVSTVYGKLAIRAHVDEGSGAPGVPAATPAPGQQPEYRPLPAEPEAPAPTPVSGAMSPAPEAAAVGGQCLDPRYAES